MDVLHPLSAGLIRGIHIDSRHQFTESIWGEFFNMDVLVRFLDELFNILDLRKSRILKSSSRKRTSTSILKNSPHMLSVNWCRLSMWMPRISPAESGCSTSISSTMGWGTSLWMNWTQKKRRDRCHAKSSPFRELLQILFYGNSAGGRTLFLFVLISSESALRSEQR